MCQVPIPPAPVVPCFLAGTEIVTATGPVPVESLAEGDVLVTSTGEEVTLRWVGHRKIDITSSIDLTDIHPICFKAGSLAENIPSRDLYVSSEHAMFIAGVLVPAYKLVNGTTIVRATECAEITYYHLECDRHVVLIANGAFAESLFDLGYKAFDNREKIVAAGDVLDFADLRSRLAAQWANSEAVEAIVHALRARARAFTQAAGIERRSADAA